MRSSAACVAATAFNAESKIGRVDADNHIRPVTKEVVHQPGADLKQLADATQHLNQPHHRQTFHGDQGVKTLGDHFIASDSDKSGVRKALFERSDQPRPENVARGLSGNNAKQGSSASGGMFGGMFRHQRVPCCDYRIMPRSEFRRESIRGMTSGTS